ncbi:MAG TPA: DinB family protein [Terriglobia bacterium]
MATNEVQQLVAILDEAYSGPAWHGPCLRGSLRGVRDDEAGWRPAPGRHNIWELVVHATYWKYAVRRRLAGGERASFGEKGNNWFKRPLELQDPEGTGGPKSFAKRERAWHGDLELLAREHGQLRDMVLQITDADLDQRSTDSRFTPRRMIAGVAMHDVYHAGQIQLLKRLAGEATVSF